MPRIRGARLRILVTEVMKVDPRKRHNPNFKENKYTEETDIQTLNARKAREYVPSLNKINKNNNPM